MWDLTCYLTTFGLLNNPESKAPHYILSRGYADMCSLLKIHLNNQKEYPFMDCISLENKFRPFQRSEIPPNLKKYLLTRMQYMYDHFFHKIL